MTDTLLILLGVALLLVVFAVILLGAYRVGYLNGDIHGQIKERLRWHEVGVDKRLAEAPQDEFTQKELDA